jgi:hypothetical protein
VRRKKGHPILGATPLQFGELDRASGPGTVLIGTAVAFGVGILASGNFGLDSLDKNY